MYMHQDYYSPCGKSRSLQKSFPNSDEETMLKFLSIKVSFIRFIDVKVLLGAFFNKDKVNIYVYIDV